LLADNRWQDFSAWSTWKIIAHYEKKVDSKIDTRITRITPAWRLQKNNSLVISSSQDI